MQIVINIDEELYDSIQYELHWEKVLEQNDIRTLLFAVDSGIVIPSRHGRLVDADTLEKKMCDREEELGDDRAL